MNTEKLNRVREEMNREIKIKYPRFSKMISDYVCVPVNHIDADLIFYREQAHKELDENLDEVERIVKEMYYRMVNDQRI